MSERNLEELSALMDGEASELEVRRVLNAIGQDQVLGEKWTRYQITREVLKGESRGRALAWQQVDLAARVTQALEAESAHSAAPARRRGDGWRPLANVAVAASVAAAVVLGWQGLQPQPVTVGSPVAVVPAPSPAVASAPAPAASGLMTVAQTRSNFRNTTAPASPPEIIRYSPAPGTDDPLNEYLISHSGNAALNTASGVAPYARVVTLRPAVQAAGGR